MSIKHRIVSHIVSQFHNPRGILGRVAGWIMGTRPSNVERTRWAVELLDVQPEHHVLEIGFGPGVGIEALAERATDGVVWGIDHSALMVRIAGKRNVWAATAGRVRLMLGSVETLPDLEPLDRILAVNNAGMWPDPPARLRELRDRLRPGGVLMIVSQPRHGGANADDTRRAAAGMADQLAAAGFTDLQTDFLETLDPPVAAVRGVRPAAAGATSSLTAETSAVR
jgi:SAM-dependent methyltransferase